MLKRFIFIGYYVIFRLVVVFRLCTVPVCKYFSLQLILLFLYEFSCCDNIVSKDCIKLSLYFSCFCRCQMCSWNSLLLFGRFVKWLLFVDFKVESLKIFISLIKKTFISLTTCSFKCSSSTLKSKQSS